jgi:hypothetical protein
MHENKLARKIKKGAVIKLILSLPLLAAAIVLIYLLFVSGLLSPVGFLEPYKIGNSLTEVDAIAGKPLVAGLYNVTLTATTDNLFDTGVEHTTDDVTDGYYFAVLVDDRFIMCYINAKQYSQIYSGGGYTFSGVLEKLESEPLSYFIDDLKEQGASDSEANEAVFKYSINATETGMFPRIMLYLVTLLLLVSGLWIAIANLMSISNIKFNSQVRKLAKYGDADSLFEEIEQEYAAVESDAHSLGKGRGWVCLADKWIILLGGLGVKFMRAEDLLWAYKLKQTTKAYGIVTTGVYYFLKLRSRGKTLSAAGKEKYVDEVLAAIFEKYQWVVVGYSAALESVFKNNKAQFASYADESHAMKQ